MKRLFGVLLAMILFCAALQAETVAVDFTLYPGNLAFDNSIYALGFEFTVSASAISVTELGVLDLRRDGFQQDQMVGLWDANGNLLASTAITNADPLQYLSTADDDTSIAGFRFHAITPVMLFGGQSYRVASQGGEGWVTDVIDPVFGSGITYVQDRWELTGSDALPLIFPQQTEAGAAGVSYFGANLIYDAVPEPTTYVLLGSGLLILMLFRRHAH